MVEESFGMDLVYVSASVVVFTGLILILVLGIIWASRTLAPSGAVKIDINEGHKFIDISPDLSLLTALTE